MVVIGQVHRLGSPSGLSLRQCRNLALLKSAWYKDSKGSNKSAADAKRDA